MFARRYGNRSYSASFTARRRGSAVGPFRTAGRTTETGGGPRPTSEAVGEGPITQRTPPDAETTRGRKPLAAREPDSVGPSEPAGKVRDMKRERPTTVSATRLLSRPPAAIPDRMEDRSLPKASGMHRLPHRVAWSHPRRFDFDNPHDLRRAYEIVLTEGLEEDVLFYIDLDRLLEVWDDLWLSPWIRNAWTEWLTARGLIPHA